MHWIDIVILVLLAISAISGFMKGFILSIASMAGFILGIILSLSFAGSVKDILISITGSDAQYMYLAAFLICFATIVLLVYLLGKLLEKVIKIVELGFLNRFAGALLGIIKTLLFIAIFIHLINITDCEQQIVRPETRNSSAFFNPLAKIVPSLLPLIKDQPENKIGNKEKDNIQALNRVNGRLNVTPRFIYFVS